MKILLAGGTGFVGKALTEELIQSGHELFIISRTKRENVKSINYIEWDSKDLMNAVNNAEIVINLAGEPIAAKRWTSEQKDLLYKSRIETTKLLVNAINSSNKKPKKLINASAIGIYGNRDSEKLTEESSNGSDFLVKLCKDWESEAKNAKTNVVILRIGIVLGIGGGALQKMLPPFKMFIGGPLGSGSQWMSWISLHDVVGIIKYSIENNNVTGILNVASPNPVTNKEFSNILGKVLNRPSFAPVPAFALKLLLGEMSDVLLGGQKAMPERVIQLGYKFRHTELEDTLRKTIS
ncbi:MAG: TIGR01777 family protein [Candidatus Melainabacteria bacterium]|nr:TIGR01777 family protein [Candidatus Melainabacteria bacterium]